MDLAAEYLAGASIPELAETHGIPRSTLRAFLVQSGVPLRTRGEATRLAASRGVRRVGRPPNA